MAARWNISPGVVVDPAIAFGKPVSASPVISTRVLQRAFEANGQNAATMATLYDIDDGAVWVAVDLERVRAA